MFLYLTAQCNTMFPFLNLHLITALFFIKYLQISFSTLTAAGISDVHPKSYSNVFSEAKIYTHPFYLFGLLDEVT